MRVILGDRSLFPSLGVKAYLNHAGISPPSEPVRAAVARIVDDYAREGAGAFVRWQEQRGRLREKLARLVGARPENIALVANTTQGISDVALCLPWCAGDRVVLSRGDFPANITPWQRAAELFGLEIMWLPQPDAAGVWLDRLELVLRRGARIVALSAVQFQTGLRLPLADIAALCRKHGAELAVDAVQACGVVPVDVAHVDYLSAGSHKWLMGTEGLAMLYVAPGKVMRPHVAGWLSHEDAVSFLFEGAGHLRYDRPLRTTARVFEGGMSNNIGCAALEASLDCIMHIGVEAIFDHVDRYGSLLESRLVAMGFTSLRAADRRWRSGIASFLPPPGVDVVALHRAIDAKEVACSTPDGHLRFSPHWPNAEAEIDGVVDAVARALG